MRAERPKARLILIGPLPPPIHGVAVSTRLALDNDVLRDRFDVEHIDTTDHRPLDTLERWDVGNVTLGLRNLAQLVARLRGGRGLVYVPVSTFFGAFLRDSLFIYAAALARWKVAVHIGNSKFREFYEGRGPLGRWWIRRAMRRAAGVAVLGPRLRHSLDGIVPPARVAVVANGTPDFAPVPVQKHPGRVLFFGNFLRGKGIAEAVEAALVVVRRAPAAEVLFAGEWDDAELEHELRARVDAGGGGRIRFLAPVSGDAKEELLQSSAVLIFPAREVEGHPRAVLEALCRGLPMVATAQANFNLGLTDGQEAFVLDQPDPARLAARVLELLADETLRARMGRAARARYEAEFTQARADQLLADWLTEAAG
jgi:glycosyltransferase involved in cell wall biosynthesis